VKLLVVGTRLWLAGLRGAMQYRTDTLIIIVMALVFQGTGFAFAWVVLSRFEAIAGWGLGEIAFLYGLRLTIHAVAGVLAGPFFGLEWQVRSGAFDRYLIRPVPPLLQFMTQSVQISVVGDLLGGLAIFAAANALTAVAWTPTSVVYLVLAILGGALVQLAIRTLIGAITFRWQTSQSFMFLADSLVSTYGNYPLTIFGSVLGFVLTFLVPIAFVAYFPATVLLGRTEELHVNQVFAFAAPIAGVVWLLVAALVFNRELSQYQSSGS
jgi:ABC-2 type transport system permease protein